MRTTTTKAAKRWATLGAAIFLAVGLVAYGLLMGPAAALLVAPWVAAGLVWWMVL
jgi:hypothetical protein